MQIFMKTYQDASEGQNRLGVGYHYKQGARSLVVPPGEVVTFYAQEDRQGWKSWPFYEGAYEDLGFYDVPLYPGCIVVEQTDVDSSMLLEIGHWSAWQGDDGQRYPVTLKLPPGEHTGKDNRDFQNDWVDFVKIPYGFTVELFQDFDANGNPTGGSLIFTGDQAVTEDRDGEQVLVEAREKHIELTRDFGWKWGHGVSGIKFFSDDWVDAGIAIIDSTIETDEESQFAGPLKLFNNAPDGVVNTVSQTVTKESSDTMEENWSTGEDKASTLGWSVDGTIEQGVEVKGGIGAVEVTSQTKVSVSAGGHGEDTLTFSKTSGGSKSTGESTSLSSQVSMESDKQGSYVASVFVDYGIIRGTAVRKIRNRKTGIVVEKHCKFERKKGFQISAEFSGQRIQSESLTG